MSRRPRASGFQHEDREMLQHLHALMHDDIDLDKHEHGMLHHILNAIKASERRILDAIAAIGKAGAVTGGTTTISEFKDPA